MSTKVKVVFGYRDLELNRVLAKGEILEVSDERAEILISKKLVQILEVKEDLVENKVELEGKVEIPQIKTKELKVTKRKK